jgi:hypothetical protein
MRLFPHHTGYDRLPINTNGMLDQETRTAGLWVKDSRYFIGSTSAKWTTLSPAYDQVHQETTHGANDLQYYGRHIPWAGSIILRISQKAKAHPHVTTVIKAVHPRF